LTRASIEKESFLMDCRVKPGNDDLKIKTPPGIGRRFDSVVQRLFEDDPTSKS